MSTLRDAIRAVPRFQTESTMNMSEVATYLDMRRPVSCRDLTTRLAAIPTELAFVAPVVTDTALGGQVRFTLRRDGTYRFEGHMRATGFPSFDYRITALVKSAGGRVQVAEQHAGEVFGTDTPGDRQDSWNRSETDPELQKWIRNSWPHFQNSTMEVRLSTELGGVLGGAVDVVRDLASIFVLAQVAGPGLAVCLVAGSELHEVGAQLPGLGGVVGLAIVAGSVVIFGPGAVVPAIVAGFAVGSIVDAMVDLRVMTDEEIAVAQEVYGTSLDFDRVRVTNLTGLGGRKFVAPALDGTILVNLGSDHEAPLTRTSTKYPRPGQILIHELAHVWQIQHFSLDDGYVPGWICHGALDTDYDYGPPGPKWSSFGIEAQGSIVDQWWAGNRRQGPNQMDVNSPYFRYIDQNIRHGLT